MSDDLSPPVGEPIPPDAPAPRSPTPAVEYEVQADIRHQEDFQRFMPLVKWLLAIPHYIVLLFLGIAAFFVALYAAFAVLFTGRYPRGAFDFVVGVTRWYWRVNAYVYLMTDDYPPFELAAQADEAAPFEVEYPEEMDRWRPFVQWLLAIPYLLVASILSYLAALMAFFAFFTILFTRKFPFGLFEIALISWRWYFRGSAYASFLVKKYPPWTWG